MLSFHSYLLSLLEPPTIPNVLGGSPFFTARVGFFQTIRFFGGSVQVLSTGFTLEGPGGVFHEQVLANPGG
ncbi:hypothetical protein DSCA_14970 [Desulfosarcina alkanivorans]|uniref:Uncharacterized protein n=1 Tax=Desulfosarcina alkanivorans TaxID=571177 RepID=A0A5K7YSE3_9BACT|nr:hypothetical protein DSCA_14970 [Desulfosarcina alkanivorans]